jgi:hypothetical protein
MDLISQSKQCMMDNCFQVRPTDPAGAASTQDTLARSVVGRDGGSCRRRKHQREGRGVAAGPIHYIEWIRNRNDAPRA